MFTRKQLYLHMKPKRLSIIVRKLKKVTFDNQVRVYEIPSRRDLFVENLIKDIWYTPLEYKLFRTMFFYD